MDHQVNLSLHQPYWPALKLILSSLIVLNFYFHLIDQPDILLLINAFNLTLIPMFVFIVAFVTKNTTWQTWRYSLIPALIIYLTFQTIDAIPLYYSNQLNLSIYLFFPQNGVWFFLATPVWQAIFLLLPLWVKRNKVFLVIMLVCTLSVADYVKDSITEISGFFSVIYFFPFFVLAYFISPNMIALWRQKPFTRVLALTLLTVGFLYYQNEANAFIGTLVGHSLFFSRFTTSVVSFIIGIFSGAIIIYLASASDKYEKITNNALGIYLIHPIICFALLEILKFFNIPLNFSLVTALALFTVLLALWLASNKIIHWFINPVLKVG